MTPTATPSIDLEAKSAAELRTLVIELLGRLAKAEAQIVVLSEEIVRLKDLNGRPKLKASGMEKGNEHWSDQAGGGIAGDDGHRVKKSVADLF
ncbi:hypothetical protein WCLP8_5010004 [uncultured Gammaproteobacteria bacterium]